MTCRLSKSVRHRGWLLLLVTIVSATGQCLVASPPATFYWDGQHLASVRESENHPPEIANALSELKEHAEAALLRGPYSVVDKDIVPPSGDKHDYLSYSRYWWPNPDTQDGLPYVRRDGVVNRELLARGDRNTIGAFYDDFETLALAAYLIDESRYAPHARLLLRTWFLDPATRMNPNLNYGQGVPGKAVGRAPGLIDTRHFIRVLEGVALLNHSGHLEETEVASLRTWFRGYLDWMLSSELGKKERRARNNHGSWYAAQASYLALFVGDEELASSIVREVRDSRIPTSIRPDGSQPEELRRTRSLHYSLFNLSALSVVAQIGDHVGVDLWQRGDGEEGGIRRGLDYVTPFVITPEAWEHPEFEGFQLSDRLKQLFILAGICYQTSKYHLAAEQGPPRTDDRHYSILLFDLPPSNEAEL